MGAPNGTFQGTVLIRPALIHPAVDWNTAVAETKHLPEFSKATAGCADTAAVPTRSGDQTEGRDSLGDEQSKQRPSLSGSK